MREFRDETGGSWAASARARDGHDYKGRWHLVFTSVDEGTDQLLDLPDVRWNSREVAERTLATMSEVELRRRLRIARGRATTTQLGSG